MVTLATGRTRRRAALIAALGLGAGALSCRSSEQAPATERVATALTNAGPTDSNTVLRVEGAVSCSGILAANQWALTARHCLSPEVIADPHKITIAMGGTRGDPAQTTAVAEVITSPRGLDLALLRLSAPLVVAGVPYGFLLRIYPRPSYYLRDMSGQMQCVGWGVAGPQAATTDQPSSATMVFKSITPPLLRLVPSAPVDQHVAAGDAGGGCYPGNGVIGMLVGMGGDGASIAIDLTQPAIRTWIESTLVARDPDLPASAASPVGAATADGQVIDLFWVDGGGAMNQTRLAADGGSSNVSLGAATGDAFAPSRPAAVHFNGDLHVLGRAGSGAVMEQTSPTSAPLGASGSWTAVPGLPPVTSGIGIASWQTDRYDIFARTAAGPITHGYWGGTWQVENIGGMSDFDVLGTASDIGTMHIFAVVGTSVIHKSTTGGFWDGSVTAWTNWDVTGALASACSAVSPDYTTIDLFGRAPNGHLAHKAFSNGWVDDFLDLGIDVPGEPTAIIAGARVHIFARNPDGSIWHAHLPR